MNDVKKVSIVMPSFNHVAFIGEALDTIVAQDYSGLECIVVDGGSTDGTQDVLRSYGDTIRWVSENDQGIYDAVNKGWGMASGEWLGWLNSDDRLVPGAIARLVRAATSTPDTRFVYGDYYRIDAAGQILETMSAGSADASVMLRKGNSIFTGACLVRRDLASRLGFFDLRYSLSADYAFLVRAVQSGHALHLPEPVAMFRCHGDSKSRNSRRLMWSEALAISEELSGRRHIGLRARVVGDELLHSVFSEETLVSARFTAARRRLRRLWPSR